VQSNLSANVGIDITFATIREHTIPSLRFHITQQF
jgi:hypothetical protein